MLYAAQQIFFDCGCIKLCDRLAKHASITIDNNIGRYVNISDRQLSVYSSHDSRDDLTRCAVDINAIVDITEIRETDKRIRGKFLHSCFKTACHPSRVVWVNIVTKYEKHNKVKLIPLPNWLRSSWNSAS